MIRVTRLVTLAMLFVLFLAATASAQSVLDDKGRVYPCVPYERNCAFPSARHPCSHGPSIRCDIASTFRPRPSWAQDRRFPTSQRRRSSAHRSKDPWGIRNSSAQRPVGSRRRNVTPFLPARRPRRPKTLPGSPLAKRAAAVTVQPHLQSKSRRARNGQRQATVAITVGKVAISASWRLRR